MMGDQQRDFSRSSRDQSRFIQKKYQKQARVWYCKTKQKTDEVNKQMRKEEIEKMKDFAKEYGRSVTKEGEGKECC